MLLLAMLICFADQRNYRRKFGCCIVLSCYRGFTGMNKQNFPCCALYRSEIEKKERYLSRFELKFARNSLTTTEKTDEHGNISH